MADLDIGMFGSIAGIAILVTIVMTVIVKPILFPDSGGEAGQDKWAGVIAIGIAILFAFLGDLILADPADMPTDLAARIGYDVAIGLLAGLTAVGGYTAIKRVTGN